MTVISINTNKIERQQKDLFGIFFEDLSHAADGGLYGELVRNRSFEFDEIDQKGYHAMTAWDAVERGDSSVYVHVETLEPLNRNNQHYVVMEVLTAGEGAGIRNLGYNSGIFIEAGKQYRFSCFCKMRGKESGKLLVRLEDESGQKCYALHVLSVDSDEWERKECILQSEETDVNARLAVLCCETGCFELDEISLFPTDTFKGRKNGLRKDIAELLADMHPGFLRFPGGCLAHIGSLNRNDRCAMYRWKNTLGEVWERPSKRNNWNYNQTFGLGFFEFFQFCEDIGAEPLPVIAAGYDPHYLRMAPLEDMQEWIDEALDLIEFANGNTDTEWGAVRAAMGHPESFGMKYLGIGNEEVGDDFFIRYEIILKAVKEKYPEIQVIGSAGPGSAGSEYEKGWEQARRTETSLMDEHFYQCPQWFIANAHRYENYEETPKVFLGEYASCNDTWMNALAEAAFMIGMEKSKAVGLACYAPLLNNIDYSNWTPTLLHYDNHRVMASCSYYVQKLFMNYMGDVLLESSADFTPAVHEVSDLSGLCQMRTENARVSISDFRMEDKENGEVYDVENFELSEENRVVALPQIRGKQYVISFRFQKENGGTAGNLNGKYSFGMDFAMRDEDNKLSLNIDGWQRLTSLNGKIDGYGCDMGLHHLITQTGKSYHCLLEVQGAEIRVYIDGEPCGYHCCREAVPDEIYYSAVKDSQGQVIVKFVNLKDEDQEIVIQGLEQYKAVKTVVISSDDLNVKNTFGEPEKIVPKESTADWNSEGRMCIPAHSVCAAIFSV